MEEDSGSTVRNITPVTWNGRERTLLEPGQELFSDEIPFAALRDNAHPGHLLPGIHIGNGLHPNDKGGEIVVGTIDPCQIDRAGISLLSVGRAAVSGENRDGIGGSFFY